MGEQKKPWTSKRRREIHSKARAKVDEIARTDVDSGIVGLPSEARLLEYYFYAARRRLRVAGDTDLSAWWTAAWRADGEPVYVAIWAPPGHTSLSALRDLCEVLQEVLMGFRKPSPDVWKPPTSP